MKQRRAPFSCANCGSDIPPHAHACPECGADERTGWAEQDIYDGLDLPEDEEPTIRTEKKRRRSTKIQLIWSFVAALCVLAFVVALFR
jgi:predicted nucleic acid-binding Zn ribbon protein